MQMLKIIKLSTLFLLKFIGIFSFARYLTRRGIRILCYHGVWLGEEGFPGDGMFMGVATFQSRLKGIQSLEFPVLSLDRAIEGRSSKNLPPCPVVITIDDGWYSTYCAMLPALQRYGMAATLYCDTAHLLSRLPIPHVMARYLRHLAESGYISSSPADERVVNKLYEGATNLENSLHERLENVRELADALSIDFDHYVANRIFGYMTPEELAEACKAGLDIQLHTHTHTMHDFSNELLTGEIEENRKQLSLITRIEPHNFKHFCYPSGVWSKDLSHVLAKAGIISATTTEQSIAFAGDDRFFLPRILDGEHLSALEFEAELCGVMELLRKMRRLLGSGARQ